MSKAFPDFDVQLKRGQIVEEELREVLCGPLEVIRLEVKSERDSRSHVFIEYMCRGKPSGISSTKAEWYAIEVYPHRFVLIETAKLAEMVRAEYLKGIDPIHGGEGGVAEGYAIQKARLLG